MSLFDDFETDMQETFFNPDEFAFDVLWNGFIILVVPEENENSYNETMGTYETNDIYHIMKSELDRHQLEVPEPETMVTVDKKSRLVKSVYDNFGCLKVEFYRNRF
jgi:hypothetical protein